MKVRKKIVKVKKEAVELIRLLRLKPERLEKAKRELDEAFQDVKRAWHSGEEFHYATRPTLESAEKEIRENPAYKGRIEERAGQYLIYLRYKKPRSAPAVRLRTQARGRVTKPRSLGRTKAPRITPRTPRLRR